MARLLGPDFVSLQVRDLAVSRAFYIDLLGFTEDPHFRAPGFVLFDTTTIPFGISEARVNLDESVHLGWGVTLWIDCDNVDELYAKLEAAGATILQQPYDSPFGRAMVFADPDGYRITANQNPWDRFPLGGRGRPADITTQPGRFRKVEITNPEGNKISSGQALGSGND